MIQLFIADESPVVLAGLRVFFSGTEFRIVGEAVDGEQLLQGIEQTFPHIVLADTTQKAFRNVSEQLLDGIIKKNRWKYRLVEFTSKMRTAPKQDIIETVRWSIPRRATVRGLSRIAQKNLAKLTPRETEMKTPSLSGGVFILRRDRTPKRDTGT